ncbi:MAG: phosphoethanolamine transferase domain-containing protein, partial [Muribaculaceae bacterium]|nr:phosphoethanolamine transferase domain-containing protein [Muribaculaceae bacterium]
MKPSDSLKKIFADCNIVLWVFPLLLIVPNIMLDITEQYSTLSRLANILVPAGWYYFIISLWRRTGVVVLSMTVFSFFAAFQIVLLNLYGESIIAIDMFINVATTNMSEATELLGNLLIAIAIICILYVPPIVAGVMQTINKNEASQKNRKSARSLGVFLILTGTLVVSIASKKQDTYRVDRELFPINVISNLCTAVSRTIATHNYTETSKNFNYRATSTHPADLEEIYVLVVGETSRAENWSLLGYDRNTNPRLAHRRDIIAYPKAMSESNTTHKSVPMILSPLDSRTFGDSIYSTRSIFDAFNTTGYTTAFISNQRRNHSFIDFFGEQASQTDFIIDDFDTPQHDMV